MRLSISGVREQGPQVSCLSDAFKSCSAAGACVRACVRALVCVRCHCSTMCYVIVLEAAVLIRR